MLLTMLALHVYQRNLLDKIIKYKEVHSLTFHCLMQRQVSIFHRLLKKSKPYKRVLLSARSAFCQGSAHTIVKSICRRRPYTKSSTAGSHCLTYLLGGVLPSLALNVVGSCPKPELADLAVAHLAETAVCSRGASGLPHRPNTSPTANPLPLASCLPQKAYTS